jgi:hypothetical protein
MKPLFALSVWLSVAGAFASDLDFTLINKTARSFEGVYITASANKDWDANILRDGKVLAAGDQVEVRFKRDEKSATWDLNLVDDQGLSITFDDIKLTNADTVTLTDVKGKVTAEIE